jgi:hypothetical protein
MHITESIMHRPEEVLERIRLALKRGAGLSLIRLASGEAFTLAHNVILPLKQIPWWVAYAGVRLPNESARRDLIQAVTQADIVGLSSDRKRWECAPLLEKAFNRFHLSPRYITGATINWHLHQNSGLYRAIANVPTIVVGRRAAEAADKLRKMGINVTHTYSLEGYEELPRIQRVLDSAPAFAVALVAAGIPASILCPRLAKKRNCVAIDYGHVINDLITPGFNINLLDQEREKWKREVHYERQLPQQF